MSSDASAKSEVEIGDYQYGFHNPTDNYEFKSRKGLDAEIVAQISEMKNEPDWMRNFHLKSTASRLPATTRKSRTTHNSIIGLRELSVICSTRKCSATNHASSGGV